MVVLQRAVGCCIGWVEVHAIGPLHRPFRIGEFAGDELAQVHERFIERSALRFGVLTGCRGFGRWPRACPGRP